ncbi:MAG: LD-carboxypeptidase [Bacteroidetes bacterium QS_4_64_154]|nr:MAG: LD-carboxypeptidase [Bacteroidetes bacterium QS_4_64_154]
MRFGLIFSLIIAIVAVLFALQNPQTMDVNLLFFETRGSTALVLMVTFALGIMVGLLSTLPKQLQARRKLKKLQRQIGSESKSSPGSSRPFAVLRRPPPLMPGAPIAVVAPASAPRTAATYEQGLAQLTETYEVRRAWRPGSERGYLSAPDADRVDALHRAIEDPDIRAIFCVRGGYGCLRLLHRIDWALARQHPTLLVGYSDVTALHLAFYTKARWTGLSGPVVTEWAEADPATLDSFQAWCRGTPSDLTGNFDAGLTPLASGTVSGPLLGGNLSVLSRLIGTPFAHLEHAGVLDAVAGVILGTFTTGELDPDKPTLFLDDVFDDYLGTRSYPVVRGLPYGHHLPRCSLPMGAPVQLRATAEETSLTAQSPVVDS